MDTTKTYIKMCDCPEIQGQKPDMGLVPPTHEDVFLGKYACYWAGDFDWVKQQSRYIWLPTQDQLQGMLEPTFKCSKGDIQRFSRYYIEQSPIVLSMEQLWLAFYMHTQYQKKWSEEEWIGED